MILGLLAHLTVEDVPEPQIVFGSRELDSDSVVSLGVPTLSICSGNLIAPRVVLSAAHCSGDLPIEFIEEFGSVQFGTRTAEPTLSIGIESAVLHPDYVPLSNGETLGEFDLAVAILDEPANIRPTPFRTLPADSLLGEEVFSVGFGIDEDEEGGEKRSTPLIISEIDPMFLISNSEDNPNGANICSGDSGGPQFLDTENGRVQVAVHSWADQSCRSVSGSTRTDVAAAWILDQVEAAHGTRDLCEAAGLYGDQSCDRLCNRIDPDCLPPEVAATLAGEGRGGCATVQVGWVPRRP